MAEVGRLQEAMACLRHLRLQGRVTREELPSGVFRYAPAGNLLLEGESSVDDR
jgi:hypothetical protein